MCICYLRPPKRRPVWTGLHLGQVDWQGVIPPGWCLRCGREVFALGREQCPRCEKEVKEYVYNKQSQSL